MPFPKETITIGEDDFPMENEAAVEKVLGVGEVNKSISCLDSVSQSECPNVAENELISFDDVDISDDEDTWLYTSPKNLSKEEKALSPYKWLRKDVEDPTNYQLQMAKTALVSKLDELNILDQSMEYGMDTVKEELEAGTVSLQLENETKIIVDPNKSEKKLTEASCVLEKARLQEPIEWDMGILSLKLKSEQGLILDPNKLEKKAIDASDILKKARQQEESLEQSSSKILREAGFYAKYGEKNSAVSPSKNVSQKTILQSSPKQSPYGSTASLYISHDLHRSSLPNLSKGYPSLKLRKSKRISEPHIRCPLPVQPQVEIIKTVKSEDTTTKSKSRPRSPAIVHVESQTLPASYRMRSRKSLVNKVEPQFSSMKRDSLPSSLCPRNCFMIRPCRRESLPCVTQAGREHRTAGTIMPTFNKRPPLIPVHNRSPLQEDHVIQDRKELKDERKGSVPSKTSSLPTRSGIPVPSKQHE